MYRFLYKIFTPLAKGVLSVQKTHIKKNTRKLEFVKTNYFGPEVDNFWQQTTEKDNIVVIKDDKFLNWRYADRPSSDCEIFVIKDENGRNTDFTSE